MSRLTEIMKQIPLDELIGDTVQTIDNTEIDITETTEETTMGYAETRANIRQSGAHVKRSGALVSAAAIAIVVLGGAFAYFMLSKDRPETSTINSSSAVSQVTSKSSSQIPSASNKAILEDYIKSKPELKEGSSDPSSLDYFDVDEDCGYGLYRGGERKCTLFKVSGGKVTEYTELKGITGGRTFELPYDIFESQIFELDGSKFAALLVEIINDDGYYPAVTIIKVDGDEPLCASIGHVGITMEKYCKGSEYAEFDVNKYPTRVIGLKDVFKVTNDGVTIDGIDHSCKNGDLVQTYRMSIEDFVGHKQGSDKLEILSAFTITNDGKFAYGAYYDRSAGRSVLCRASDQTVVEHPDKLFTGDSNMCITGRIYNMESYTVVNGSGTKELLVILADKVTNGGGAPMIVVLDISSESPSAIMSEPVMIDMTHYDKNATITKDGDTTIYGVSKFDDTVWTYCQTTDKGLKIDGKLFTINNGKLVEDKTPTE